MEKNRIGHVMSQTAHAQNALLEVSDMLREIGVPAHVVGYRYLREAILLTAEAPDLLRAVTTRLYPMLAVTNKTTASGVERAIRHAIELAWDRGDMDVLASYFGGTIQCERGKPTNSEFIAMLADRLQLAWAFDASAS